MKHHRQVGSIGRRAFAAGAASLAMAPLAARAQAPGRVYRLAVVHAVRPVEEMTETGHPYYRAFFSELRRLGYVEGANLVVQRWSGIGIGETQFGEFANRIVATKPDVILPNGSRLILAFKAATTTIPVVMLSAADPIAWRIVERLNRPGGNLTGFASDAGVEEVTKRMQFLSEIAPGLKSMAFLGTPESWGGPGAAFRSEAAARLGVKLVPALVEGAVTAQGVRKALYSISDPIEAGLLVSQGAEITEQRTEIAKVALELRMPSMGFSRFDAGAGFLMSYAGQVDDAYQRAAGYVDRILKGTNPGELPVQQPTRFDFVINKKTADALGLTIPMHLWVFATEIIE